MTIRRGNQEGAIYKRPSGRWQAQATLNAKRISKTFDTQKECRVWLRQIDQQKEQGLTIRGVRLTYGEYLDQWLKDVKGSLRSTTLMQYESVVKNSLKPYLGGYKLSDLGPREIQNLYSIRMEQGLGARTVQMIHAVIHRSLHVAVKQGLIGSNPAKRVEKPKHRKARMQILDDMQVRTLLVAAEGTPLEALIQVAVTTGMRKGEILGLKWSDIDWAGSTLQVDRQLLHIPKQGLVLCEPKTDTSIRTVMLGSGTLSKLGDHLDRQDQDKAKLGDRWEEHNMVFPSSVGTPKGPRNIIREFKALLEKAGLPDVRFHDLRHTAASLMLMSNMPIMRIARQLGHAKASTTLDIYGHLIPGLGYEAAEKIDKLVQPIAAELQKTAAQLQRRG